METKNKTGLIIFFLIIAIILIGIGTGHVIAVNGFSVGELADSAKNNTDFFWNQFSVGDAVNTDVGVESKPNWICLSEKKNSGVGSGNNVKCIIDINRYQNGTYSTSIYGQNGVSNRANDTNTKKLAYLCYAATYYSDTGYVSENSNGPRNALYYFFNSTNLEYLIGNFSKKRTDSYLDVAQQRGEKILNYANTYASSETTGSSATITSKSDSGAEVVVSTDSNGTSYSYIGPFSMKTSGDISSVSIKDGNNTPTVAGYANSVGGTVKAISGLPKNGNNFYIATTAVLTNSNVTVTINTSGTAGGGKITDPKTGAVTNGYIKARMIFIGSDASQGVSVFRGDIVPSSPSKDSVTFTAKNNLGKMLIQKVGAYAGNNGYENVRDFGFKIYYLDGTTKKYLRINDTDTISGQATVSIGGQTSYSANADSATTVFTSSNGTVTIDNISIEYAYYIEESNTSSTNYKAEIISATIQYGKGETTELGVENNIAGPITVELKGSNNTITKVMLLDYRKTGSLAIEKVDSDNYNTKLGDVEFKIKNKDTGYYVIANKIADGKYTITDPLSGYVQNEAEAMTFVTSTTTGTIEISGLDIGDYEIIEVNNPGYGYTVLQQNISITIRDSETVTTTVKNEKQTGNLRISKKDADNINTMIPGVSFKIKNSEGKYVIAIDTNGEKQSTVTGIINLGDMEFTSNEEEATIFITNDQGIIEIHNILIDTYTIEEISVGDNYGYILDDDNITWKVDTKEGKGAIGTIKVKRQSSDNTVESDTKLSNSNVNIFIVKNEKQTGNLKITKEDADNSNTVLSGVSFRIKNSEGKYVIAVDSNGQKQTTVTGSIYLGNMEFTSNEEEATTFITNNQGVIEVHNILIDDYIVEEISVGDHYGYILEDKNIAWDVEGTTGTGAKMQVVLERESSDDTKDPGTNLSDSNATVTIVKNEKQTGNLKITKEDADNSNTVLSGVSFRIKNSEGKYVIAVDSNGQKQTTVTGSIYLGNMEFTSNEEEATTFITNNQGVIEVHNILIDDYIVEEISVGDHYGYILEDKNIAWDVEGTTGTGAKMQVVLERESSDDTKDPGTNLSDSNATVTTVKNEKQTGNIKIYKKDPDSGVALVGMSFKVKNSKGQYVIAVAGQNKEVQKQVTGKVYLTGMQFTENESEATEFITDSNGIIEIDNILIDDYTIEEISVGDNYYGYEVDGDYIIWQVDAESEKTGTTSITATIVRQTSDNTKEDTNVTDSISNVIKVNNRRKYVKLSGYVWEDMIAEKESVRNNLYMENDYEDDKLLENVTVKLKDSSGNLAKAPVVTGKDGAYLFEDVEIDQIPNLYIEFTYNGMSYECVSVVDLNKANSSKASEGNERTIFNEEYNTITKGQSNNANGSKTHDLKYDTANYQSTLHLGDNLVYGYDGQEFPINGVYEQYEIQSTTLNAYNGYLDKVESPEDIRKNGTEELTDLNLGVRERERPDLSVVKDVYSAKVTINGQEHTYLYEDRLKADNSGNLDSVYNMDPQVKFGLERGNQTYTRPLYASDVHYTGANSLEVKVIYRIGICNQSTNLITTVNELNDYFDTKYETNSAKAGLGLDSNGNIQEGGITVSGAGSYNGEYSKITLKPNNLSIPAQTEQIIYVELTVKAANIVDILDRGEDVKLDNVTEINSYSTKDANGNTYGAVDKDSQPGNAEPGNTETYEDDTDKAPGILLVLQDERLVEGMVFEDVTTGELKTGQIREADGQYTNADHGIEGVQVEVIKLSDGTTAQIYNSSTRQWEDAKLTTKSDGSYYLGGFIPDDYKIVYTWGGQTYTDSSGVTKTYTVQDYKGTIVNENSHEAKDSNNQWYKDSFKQNYPGVEWNTATNQEIRVSDAIDDYETRQRIDDELKDVTYETKTSSSSNNEMESTTPNFKINIEYTEGSTNIRDEYEFNSDGSLKMENGYAVKKDGYRNALRSIDFGIVERARQTLALDKYVQHIKLTLSNGNSIVDADIDENGNIIGNPSYITYIKESEEARAKVKVEIDNELVQGATLEVTYGLKVTNIGEVDYTNRNYYYYGSGHGETENEMVTLKASEIIDYLDGNLSIEENNNMAWKTLSDDEVSNYIGTGTGKYLSNTQERVEYMKTIERAISTDELKDIELKPISGQNTTSSILKGTRLLSNNDEVFVENNAEIIHVEKTGGSSLTTTPGNYVPTDASTSEVDNDYSEEIAVVPPTGSTDNTISYVILGISSLGILIAGIVLIKRFAIK